MTRHRGSVFGDMREADKFAEGPSGQRSNREQRVIRLPFAVEDAAEPVNMHTEGVWIPVQQAGCRQRRQRRVAGDSITMRWTNGQYHRINSPSYPVKHAHPAGPQRDINAPFG